MNHYIGNELSFSDCATHLLTTTYNKSQINSAFLHYVNHPYKLRIKRIYMLVYSTCRLLIYSPTSTKTIGAHIYTSALLHKVFAHVFGCYCAQAELPGVLVD
jgi:hypothetical protein